MRSARAPEDVPCARAPDRRVPAEVHLQPGITGQELSSKIYVGNLSFNSTQEDLRELFARHGEVAGVQVITDRETGRPRGFAFVEMGDSRSAEDAIRSLDGSDFGGRTIKVNQAQDRRTDGGGARRF